MIRTSFIATFALFVGLLAWAGCSGKPDSEPAPAAPSKAGRVEQNSPKKKKSDRETDHSHSAPSAAAPSTSAKAKNQKLDGIPLDVWFDDPLSIAKPPDLEVAAASVKESPATVETTTSDGSNSESPAASKESASSGSAEDWKSILAAETLQDEVKRIRVRLPDFLRSVVKYNAHYKEIQVDAIELAALAEIAIAHPESVSWKPRAKHLRDLAVVLAEKSKGLGAKSQGDSQRAFENVTQLLDGNLPADLPESADQLPFSEFAGRAKLMVRMQSAADALKGSVKTEADLKKNADDTQREASVLAALGKVISSPGYGSADEPEYQEFAKALIQANLDIASAAKNQDLGAFNEARSRSEKACANCHQSYRFEDGN